MTAVERSVRLEKLGLKSLAKFMRGEPVEEPISTGDGFLHKHIVKLANLLVNGGMIVSRLYEVHKFGNKFGEYYVIRGAGDRVNTATEAIGRLASFYEGVSLGYCRFRFYTKDCEIFIE